MTMHPASTNDADWLAWDERQLIDARAELVRMNDRVLHLAGGNNREAKQCLVTPRALLRYIWDLEDRIARRKAEQEKDCPHDQPETVYDIRDRPILRCAECQEEL